MGGTMEHVKMHHLKRDPPEGLNTVFASTRISAPGESDGTQPTATGLTVDGGAQSAFTTILQTIEQTIAQPATTLTSTAIRTISVTDAASYSSLQASESSARAQSTKGAAADSSSTHTSSSSSAETSKAASGTSSSNNLGTLIPAIVVPVAVLLIASFALFWFFMRRRHQRQLKKEPEFVMAGKPEKGVSRRSSGSSGHSSTRELVPMSKLEKEVAITTSEVKRPSMDLFPPKYSSSDIGLARPMTPPDQAGSKANSNERPVPNFSSVRPTSSHRVRPSQDRDAGGGNRSRSHSTTTHRSIGRASPPKSSRGPSPTMRGFNAPSPRRDGSRELPPAGGYGLSGGLPPLNTAMNGGNRAAPPKALSPPTPTGAFNGASPISQYSPIVKGHPSLGAIAAANTAASREKVKPSKSSYLASYSRGTDSPVDENVLSQENMRIARLANSSRLGYSQSPDDHDFPTHPNSNNTRGLSPLYETHTTRQDPPATSPRLPPPLTRGGPDSPVIPRLGGGPSTISLPHSERTIGVAASSGLDNRASVISGLSSDDDYVDMDVDAKSDVSSLDEREKWEMESERRDTESQLGTGYHGSGYGSTGVSPVDGPAGISSSSSSSAVGTGSTKPNLRDRDSEGPFVLSRY